MTRDHPADCPCWSCVSAPRQHRAGWPPLLVAFGIVLGAVAVVAGVGLLVGWLT